MIYVPNKPITELKPVQALALINRWVKLKSYFYYADVDALYELKDRKIAEWVEADEMVATKIIMRPSPAIESMKTEIANGGTSLDALGYCDTVDDWDLEDWEKQHYDVLVRFCCNDDYEVSFPDDIAIKRQREHQKNMNVYLEQKSIYDSKMKQRQPLIDAYNKACNEWVEHRQKAAKQWASENHIKIARSNSGRTFKKDWVERLEQQGFKYNLSKPVNPWGSLPKIVAPQKPEYPELTYTLSPENYIPRSVPEIESALSWAKSVTEVLPDYSELSDEYVDFDLSNALRDADLEATIKKVLAIFQRIVNRELATPEEIYEQLTQYQVDHENAIGMSSSLDRWNNYSHKDFSKWHEINLSHTGYWLVEFQNIIDEPITFHVPYDRRLNLDTHYRL